MSLKTTNTQQGSRSRKVHKRSLNSNYCFKRNPSESNCCLRELYIDFHKDLGWNWIVSPLGYKANFCAGACPYLWSVETQHSAILNLYRSMNPLASSSPCCTPLDMDPLLVMYYSNGVFEMKQLPSMTLLSCSCR